MLPDWSLALFFLIIAFTYASVGFGGGSSYLAILAVAGLPFPEIRLTALICNILVVTGAVLLFWQHKQLDLRKILPLVLVSIPLAFIGAKMRIEEAVFFKLLGCSLLAASTLLWFQPAKPLDDLTVSGASKPGREALLGGDIGLLSGMVGIGGGIFLSPILHILRWDTARKIAATASVFILVNSLAGLGGQLAQLPADLNWNRILLLGSAVFVGGQLGSRISIKTFDARLIRRITALLVFMAG
ncbi:MAG: sulfite exporter TauE/SafE family protein, partial [Saprospiraceae bacterium]